MENGARVIGASNDETDLWFCDGEPLGARRARLLDVNLSAVVCVR